MQIIRAVGNSRQENSTADKWIVVGEAACLLRARGDDYRGELGKLEADLVHWQAQNPRQDSLQLHPLDLAKAQVCAIFVEGQTYEGIRENVTMHWQRADIKSKGIQLAADSDDGAKELAVSTQAMQVANEACNAYYDAVEAVKQSLAEHGQRQGFSAMWHTLKANMGLTDILVRRSGKECKAQRFTCRGFAGEEMEMTEWGLPCNAANREAAQLPVS
ncbi:hypothetical protein WJX73_005713 [Symbiochloris irregularis]|uniref:Uncharacterized protein n=1 Tax=Symbiochloris irregularis TaxID=706552 RepID=A0AAW1PV12_9CHLO